MKNTVTEHKVHELISWVNSIGKQILDGTLEKEPNGKHLLETFMRMVNLMYGKR